MWWDVCTTLHHSPSTCRCSTAPVRTGSGPARITCATTHALSTETATSTHSTRCTSTLMAAVNTHLFKYGAQACSYSRFIKCFLSPVVFFFSSFCSPDVNSEDCTVSKEWVTFPNCMHLLCLYYSGSLPWTRQRDLQNHQRERSLWNYRDHLLQDHQVVPEGKIHRGTLNLPPLDLSANDKPYLILVPFHVKKSWYMFFSIPQDTELTLSEGEYHIISDGQEKESPLQISTMGIYLVVETNNGLILSWDMKTSIFIKLSPNYKVLDRYIKGMFYDWDANHSL